MELQQFMLSHLTDGAKLPEIFLENCFCGLNYAEKHFKLDAKEIQTTER